MSNALEQVKTKMVAVLEHFSRDLKGIRSGRANPAILDGVSVDIFGSATKVKALASITIPESRQILITPYDRGNAGAIAKAIEKANLGLQPVLDGNAIRIKISPMDTASRQDMVKLAKRKAEEAKVSIRSCRRDANELIKKQKTAGDLAEDLMKKFEKQIQELTDKSCKEADDLATSKEKEIMEV
ncbi:MAG: ribosome recycling factor [Chlamydiae bacterium]|nr:ribosome recycling factor [Chlamydiota bacterium]